MSVSRTWLVTGSSRGLGFELVRQLLTEASNTVIATCRNPDGATSLKSLRDAAEGQLHVMRLDVSDETSIRSSAQTVGEILGDGRGLDYLINNAAISNGNDTAFEFSASGFESTLKSNVIGPALLGQVLLPYLLKGQSKVIVNFSSGLGSIGLDYGGQNATYSISKTAVNMLTYKQAKAQPELIAIAVDPGWVKTDMGGEKAPLEPHESVSAILKLVNSLDSSNSGKYYRYDGDELLW
ncbi:NAD(P)-binding protein [Obba rivulosa]|uniref:NAD(P)-binding protein n=1 Tax=Obba rivulosa TaxID=1052685 RepID=A0A8E2AJ31_9APHY|nr:NAD(P)-binding protein [Obba rivulosa]